MFRPSTVTPMTPRNTTYSISNFSAILSPTCRPATISPARCLPSWSRVGGVSSAGRGRVGHVPRVPHQADHLTQTQMLYQPNVVFTPISSSSCSRLQCNYCHNSSPNVVFTPVSSSPCSRLQRNVIFTLHLMISWALSCLNPNVVFTLMLSWSQRSRHNSVVLTLLLSSTWCHLHPNVVFNLILSQA